MQLGWTLMFLGECEDAIPLGEKSLRLSQRDPNINYRYELLRYCHLVLNHVDEAIALLIKGRTANPRDWFFSFGLAGALALKGDFEGAKAKLAESLKLRPEVNSLAQWRVWVPWTLRGHLMEYGYIFRRALPMLKPWSPWSTTYSPHFPTACVSS